MENLKRFKILFRYFKNDKFKLFCYIFFTFIKYFQPLLGALIWSVGFDALYIGNWNKFFICLGAWSSLKVFVYTIMQIPIDYLYVSLENKFTVNISKEMYEKVSNLPAIAFEDIGTGEFVNRLYSDPDRILDLLSNLIRLFSRLLIAIIVVIISFNVSLYIGLELMILVIVMYILSNVYFPKIKSIQEQIKKESDDYVKQATQNISGIREIKALGLKEIVNDNMFSRIDKLFTKQKNIGKTEVNYYAINNLCYFVIEFVILFTCAYLLKINVLTIGAFVLLEKYLWRIDEVVESLAEFGVNYNKLSVSIKRIDEIINNRLYEDEKFGNKEIKSKKCEIEFKDVIFKYREEEELILKGLNMKIIPNKKIAIVGRSGQGKSTLFNLLSRYFDVTEGNILVNGIDIKDLNEEALRSTISIIRQTPYLFNLTIMDNFRMIKKDVSLEEVKKVCKEAYIDEYIESLPNGYDTIIGEGGVNLSGGQKQRIAIARTLLKDTKVILFDEATSALDNQSQEYIKKTIDKLVKDHTIIIVAHRLSTIIDADLIYVIDDGKVLASGTHSKLIKECPAYRNLYSGEIIE